MKSSAADRRKKTRVPVQSKIRHSQYQVLGTPVFQENSSIDLSSGGIAFETARDYQKGNLVLLEVAVENEKVKLLVCVAWVKPGKDGLSQVGAELIAVDPVDKKKMQNHLARLISSVKSTRKVSKVKATQKKVTKKKVIKKKLIKKKTVKSPPSTKKKVVAKKKKTKRS